MGGLEPPQPPRFLRQCNIIHIAMNINITIPLVCKSNKHLSIDKSKKEKWKEWSHYVTERVIFLLNRENPLEKEKVQQWRVTVREFVHVKSCAPHVDHLQHLL